MIGFLNIDKPPGRGSRDVTTRLAYKLKPHKVGHVGTLDPLATGVLVLCVGRATRLVDRLHEQPKEYVATFRWNARSDTEDVSGDVETVEHPPVTAEQLTAQIPAFTGSIEQVPPAFSAKKIAGRRAYDLARRGRDVELPPKSVEIHELELLSCDTESFRLRIDCGTGTYIRSLGRDLAAACGGSSVMSELRRTRVGPFRVEDSVEVEDAACNAADHLIDPAIAVTDLPRIVVDEVEERKVLDGRIVAREGQPNGPVAFFDGEGQLLGMGECIGGLAKPRTVLRLIDRVKLSELGGAYEEP